jgi:hypothetical protein
MSVVHSSRAASIDEIAAEMDRRGAVIEQLEAERNLYKGKYRALLKLVSKTRDKLVHVTDHIQDEGDRCYFGSTNDADDLRDLYHRMMSWIWDATDETNRMKSDPYADIRQQRARAEKAEEISSLLLENLKDARRLLSDQEEIDLVYLDEVIAKAEEPS